MADADTGQGDDAGGTAIGTISPADEARFAFQRQQADTQTRGQTQAAFDTLRRQRAFTSEVLKGGSAVRRAFQEQALGQGLSGAPPAQQ